MCAKLCIKKVERNCTQEIDANVQLNLLDKKPFKFASICPEESNGPRMYIYLSGNT